MRRTPIAVTAVALATALAVSACGPVRLGAAAITGNKAISTATLSAEVTNLNAAYQADKSGIQLQFSANQMSQTVLSWLLRFRVREQLASRNGVTLTRADIQTALSEASAQAKQSGVTLKNLAVANGVPPDQLTELGRYVAIQDVLLRKLDGGTLPTSQSGLASLSNRFNTDQCKAAKSLDIKISPQFGELDYTEISVLPAPDKLAALPGRPSPSPTGTAAPQLTPHC